MGHKCGYIYTYACENTSMLKENTYACKNSVFQREQGYAGDL